MNPRLLILALGAFAVGTDNYVVAGVLPEISQSFGVSIGAAGQMVTVYALTYALLAPTIATLAAGLQRRHLLLFGAVVFVVANLGTAFAPHFSIAIAMRMLAGLGAAIISPTTASAATAIVPSQRRGFALSVIVAGLTISTALGSPIGAVIGGIVTWHWTMFFVAALAGVMGIGVLATLGDLPMLPVIPLAERLVPLADARIGLTLATSFLFGVGAFTIYTYFTVVFAGAIGGDPVKLAALLALFGLSGTAATLLSGRFVDRVGSHKVLVVILVGLLISYLLMPWTGSNFWSAIPTVLIWGAAGWGMIAPQQYRLVNSAPAVAPIVLGLNNSATFLGTTIAGVVGALGIRLAGASGLACIAVAFTAGAFVTSEFAERKIGRSNQPSGCTSSI